MQKLIPAIAGALVVGAASAVIKRRTLKKAALATGSKVTKLLAPRSPRSKSGAKRKTTRKRA